jgi:hypothetical protein
MQVALCIKGIGRALAPGAVKPAPRGAASALTVPAAVGERSRVCAKLFALRDDASFVGTTGTGSPPPQPLSKVSTIALTRMAWCL